MEDDDDEHEGLDDREAQEEEFGSRKRHAHSIVVNQASKSEWSTDDASSFDETGGDIASRSREREEDCQKNSRRGTACSPRYTWTT